PIASPVRLLFSGAGVPRASAPDVPVYATISPSVKFANNPETAILNAAHAAVAQRVRAFSQAREKMVAHSPHPDAAGSGRAAHFRLQPSFGAVDVPLHVSRVMRHVLGISAFYHDSAAALVTNGQIIAAAQEERF